MVESYKYTKPRSQRSMEIVPEGDADGWFFYVNYIKKKQVYQRSMIVRTNLDGYREWFRNMGFTEEKLS